MSLCCMECAAYSREERVNIFLTSFSQFSQKRASNVRTSMRLKSANNTFHLWWLILHMHTNEHIRVHSSKVYSRKILSLAHTYIAICGAFLISIGNGGKSYLSYMFGLNVSLQILHTFAEHIRCYLRRTMTRNPQTDRI